MNGKKKLSPVMTGMVIMMIVLAVMSLINIVMKVSSIMTSGGAENTVSSYAHGWFHLMNTLALGSGIIYLLKGYSKSASGFYKAFLMLTALANASFAVLVIATRENGSSGFYDICLPIIIMGIEVIILLILSFMKDLGKAKTWLLFIIMIAADVLFGVLFISSISSIAVKCVVILTKLSIDATIALAIYAKYTDKTARGTR